MIRHSVYFKFKPETDAASRAQHITDFAALPGKISAIAGYEAGAVFAGPDAKGNDPAFDVAHQVLFRDRAGLEEYIPHPAHREFGNRNRSSWERVLVVDAEVEGKST